MKYYELTNEEKRILKDVETGKYVRVKNFSLAKKNVTVAAKNTLSKTKNINIRLSEKVLAKLKCQAAKEGIPYQTLAASILHKSVTSC